MTITDVVIEHCNVTFSPGMGWRLGTGREVTVGTAGRVQELVINYRLVDVYVGMEIFVLHTHTQTHTHLPITRNCTKSLVTVSASLVAWQLINELSPLRAEVIVSVPSPGWLERE